MIIIMGYRITNSICRNRWKFAYNCIMEEQVQRRRKMWSWENIAKHRSTCKKYKDCYKKKLTLKKVPSDLQKQLEVCLVVI